MNMYEQRKFNQVLLTFATCFFIGAVIMIGCNKVWTPIEDVEQLGLVAHDISLDIQSDQVFASDFVSVVHLGSNEERYEGPVEFEIYVPHLEDPWWMTQWGFECEDVGVVDIWVRALYADPHEESNPVKVQLTLGDSAGQCGWPQDPEAPSEHGEQEE